MFRQNELLVIRNRWHEAPYEEPHWVYGLFQSSYKADESEAKINKPWNETIIEVLNPITNKVERYGNQTYEWLSVDDALDKYWNILIDLKNLANKYGKEDNRN